ncbi:MAG: ABC-ATPase domain-containing protein [Actinobacteria bacterium]|nr:ABC-ATPase domain-containing protein [Actinomycetota bacterium]
MMPENLKTTLSRLDRKGYKAYQSLKGSYTFPDFILFIDHVQPDPFAPPTKLRVRVPQDKAKFPPHLFSTPSRKTALEDYITRIFSKNAKLYSNKKRGTGKSGIIHIDCGRQEILKRTSCLVNSQYVEIRFYAGLPSYGRAISANQCLTMLTEEIPKIVASSLFYEKLNHKDIKMFVEVNEDQDYLRGILEERGLVSFIKNGSILPRRSGISDRPLPSQSAVIFKSPPELEVTLKAPNLGELTGMGIPKGVTLIIGGGFHGKTTLLKAIEKGVYNHIPGDGREYVVTIDSAIKIRAEEGRNIQKVDISNFISNLPFKKDTTEFSTANASGSTSQAANIIEALECKSKLLLIDEDTSATNFLIRDEIMQKIIPKEKEPITPFIDQVRNIYTKYGTSTIMVMGGTGDYFEVADTVIAMDYYLPYVVTEKAKKIIGTMKSTRLKESPYNFKDIAERIPTPSSINPYKGKRQKVKSKGLSTILFGLEKIDLSSIEQIVDPSQVNAISSIILYALRRKYIDGKNTIWQILELVFNDIDKYGLDIISEYKNQHPGSHALPRRFEVAAAINRLRSLKVIQNR